MSAKDKILKHLSKQGPNNTLTAAEARTLFGISNVSARIEELRSEGHCIYTDKKTLANGRTVTFYRLGKPTKEMVAMVHAVLGSQAFA